VIIGYAIPDCHRLGLAHVTVDENPHPGDDIQIVRCRAGARLASCRREAGLSQPQLGQALGRTRSLISKVEHGARTMPAAGLCWSLPGCRAAT
jgi:DNA-binding XRE family transcriptional regulator